MAKYKNYDEYFNNDPHFLRRVLRNEIHKTQSKIFFEDGTTYHVTKSGSRYWHKGDYIHREDGPAAVWNEGHDGNFYLFSVRFDEDEFWDAVDQLNELRVASDNHLEMIMEPISENVSYQMRGKIWKTLMLSERSVDDLLTDLNQLSVKYVRLSSECGGFVSGVQVDEVEDMEE